MSELIGRTDEVLELARTSLWRCPAMLSAKTADEMQDTAAWLYGSAKTGCRGCLCRPRQSRRGFEARAHVQPE
jgi:hypothetical protein